ncbi:DUF3396 domain-containing protein [Myxococcaceae bacterium GXIMD 01537]
MNEHYPRIRVRAKNGRILLREGLAISFYMAQPHPVLRSEVTQALDVYLRAVGPQALTVYADMEGEWQDLDDAGWELCRRELQDEYAARLLLADNLVDGEQYQFEYWGKSIDAPRWTDDPTVVSMLSFWLPTEFLEEHGPAHVRELALAMAAPLPFFSGGVGLSFNGGLDLVGVIDEVAKRAFRYPGLDIPRFSWRSMHMGPRHIQGVSWLTFLGQPVLGELGGASTLRERLHSAGTSVQELDGERAVVTLGPWPEAGDTAQGNTLPAYRELARVLEPWLYFEERPRADWDARGWERRFLD